MKKSNQERVWDALADDWHNFRVEPVSEAIEFLKNKKGNILDLACGSGRNFTKIDGVIYAVDFSKNQLNFAKRYAKRAGINIATIKASCDKLPFKDEFFDAAIFISSLHCIDSKDKREKSLRELYRVMKKKAECLITVWDKNQERFKKEKKEIFLAWNSKGKKYMRYYYLYDKKELIELLEKVGFKIIKLKDRETDDSFFSKRNILVYVKK